MWIIIFLLVLVFSISGIVFLVNGFHKFSFITKLAVKNKPLSWAAAILPVALIVVLTTVLLNVWAMTIVLIHLFIFWAAAAGIGRLIRRKREMKRNFEGLTLHDCISVHRLVLRAPRLPDKLHFLHPEGARAGAYPRCRHSRPAPRHNPRLRRLCRTVRPYQ